MTNSPEHLPHHPPDFRAPPPSPIANASGRRSSVVNDDVISEFLEHSLRIPDLVLPDRIFPVEIPVENPPAIDFQSLISSEKDSISDFLQSIGKIGCFSLVNHGISRDLIRMVTDAAFGVFELSAEEKEVVSRSPERMYGFEEFFGCGEEEEEMETSEEFVWFKDEDLKSVMEGIWPDGYSNFSSKMENLSSEIEQIASKILQVLFKQGHITPSKHTDAAADEQEMDGLICCLYKHCPYTPISQLDCSLRSDIIRMLIRGSDFSHSLCVHICDRTSEFHVYSKKGWISFCPNRDAIVITIGDQIQAWSGGQYKNVMGRPVFKMKDEESISMAFLYSPPPIITQSFLEGGQKTVKHLQSLHESKDKTMSIRQDKGDKSVAHIQRFHEDGQKTISIGQEDRENDAHIQSFPETREKTISIRQQVILALLLTLIYHVSVCIFKKF